MSLAQAGGLFELKAYPVEQRRLSRPKPVSETEGLFRLSRLKLSCQGRERIHYNLRHHDLEHRFRMLEDGVRSHA